MKRFFSVFLIIILIFSLVACGTAEDQEDPGTNNSAEDIDPGNNGDEDVNEDEDEETSDDPDLDSPDQGQEVSLYFVNSQYIESGDEDLDKLIPEERTIEYDDISLEEAIVRNLMEGPKDENLDTLIPEEAELLEVNVSDGTAFVNFSKKGMNGGSMQETFTIDQIVTSLLELDSVDKVQFLLDGEKEESLMGHIEIMHPFD